MSFYGEGLAVRMNIPAELFKIDPENKQPLYDQIESNLSELIITGRLQTGQNLPSEYELAETYGVSRLTLRKALDELVRKNWLVRKRGIGTFVSNPRVVSIAPVKMSFTEEMHAIGRRPGSRLINLEVRPADARVADRLLIEEGDPVVVLTRVRMADDAPILLETSYLSTQRFPNLQDEPSLANGSLYALLAERYGELVVNMDQTLKPVLLSEAEAGYLDALPGSPAIASDIVAFNDEGEPVEYSWSVTSGDKCEFYFRFRHEEITR